jgi:Family of unknown function (DUF5367)
MNMNSYSFMQLISIVAVATWAVATLGIRAVSRHVPLPQDHARSLLLFGASFLGMATLIPAFLAIVGVPKARWFAAVTILMLPTLIFDALSCLFYQRVFPGGDPKAAATFGGWMLISCAGAVVGVWMAQ